MLHFEREGNPVFGIDNNLRREFFGAAGDTRSNLVRKATRHFTHLELDIRDRTKILELFKQERFDLIIHCAAQPSRDQAREIPFVDFEVNAVGTLPRGEDRERIGLSPSQMAFAGVPSPGADECQ